MQWTGNIRNFNWKLLFALLIPFVAFSLQWAFWAAISPFAWFLFFPAVFFSSWMGGLAGGIAATLLSTALAVYFFIPPQMSWLVSNPINLISIAMFMGMGVLFSFSHQRLRMANLKAEQALAAATDANERLLSANDEITRLYTKTKELDELKSQFFANVSHELRTPLTLILGPLESLLKAGDLPEEHLREAIMAQRNAALLYRHVNDLLDVSKLETGRMSIHYSEADLVRISAFTVSHFESVARDMDIRLSTRAPASLMAQVDAEKFMRVLLNLLSNALKFTPAGGAVTVSLVTENDSAVLQVSDTGPGVPVHLREAVFERFRQVEGGAQRRFGGTGLGLAIAREFTHLHGGTITLDDAPGGGALFTVRIPQKAPQGYVIHPLQEVSDAAIAQQTGELKLLQAGPSDAATGFPANGRFRVLVVEDNFDMSTFLCQALNTTFQVICAFNGREGLEKALNEQPDLILSDVMMPVMSGDQMVQELRRHPEMNDIPIIMLTAKADDPMRLNLLKGSVQDYITKPFSTAEVLAKIEGLLRNRRRHQDILLETNKRFQATFEQAAVGIAHMGLDGRWLQVNRKLCDITGYANEELLQMRFQDVTHPDDLDADLALVRQVLSGDIDTYSIEKRYLRKSGQQIWIRLTVSLVRDGAGDPQYLISVVEDIQARKDTEAAVKRSLTEKDTLLKEIHHRVKNNLQIITSLISLQFDGAFGTEEFERASQLSSRIRSMALIHEQLYKSGSLTAIDMAPYIVSLVDSVTAAFSLRAGMVEPHINVEPVRLGIDSAVPCGLLLNELITNALKHAFANGRNGMLGVSLRDKDGRAVLVVQDDGPCFPVDMIMDDSTHLGLQLVKELARQLKGELRMSCAPGARVELSFPIGSASEEARLVPDA